MLNDLKNGLNKRSKEEFISTVTEAVDDGIKDFYLDDTESALVGAEDDPEIAKLIDKLPEYDGDDVSDKDIESLTENFIPESKF